MSLLANTTATGVHTEPPTMLLQRPALDNTFGALLLGTFGGLILFGMTAHQAYLYFRMYPNDGRILKTLVIAVVIVETFTVMLTIHFCYYNLVTNYANPQALQYNMWSIDLFSVMSGVTMVLSQSFFIRRLWLVAPRYRPVVMVAVILCLAEIGFLLAGSVKAFIIPTYAQYSNWQWLVSSGSTLAFAADTLLTVLLIIVLRKSRTGIKRTDSMLDLMIIYAVNTGLVTGIFNVLTVVFSFAQKDNLIWIGIGIIDVKMYAITLLAALNSRQSLAERGTGVANATSPFGVSGISWTSQPQAIRRTNAIVQAHTTQVRSGNAVDELDLGSVIELKAARYDTTLSSITSPGGRTIPVSLEKPAPTRAAAEYAAVGVDGHMVVQDQKTEPV